MSKSLPLVHLSVLRPVLSGLRERGIDPDPVLGAAGLTEEAVGRDDTTVHVMVIHHFLERSAEAAGDRTFCARVAAGLDPNGWPMIARALEHSRSLAEFLSMYVSGANEVASSVTAYLEIRGAHADFGETRLFRPTIAPAQNDAFMIGLGLSILRRALGERLDPRQVSLIVCDPAALPPALGGYHPLRGDEMGSRIRFPSAWLSYSVGRHEKTPCQGSGSSLPRERDFLSGFQALLGQAVAKGGLSAETSAALVSMSPHKLARRLKGYDTTISAEINRSKLSHARQALAATQTPVAEIAVQLGYADPSNFARWFKRAAGEAPSTFRRNHAPEQTGH